MEPRSRASLEQFKALLDFMESHGDISRPQQGVQGRMKADRLWLELVELLNSTTGGVIKSIEKWKKVWADWKTKTKKKGLALHRKRQGTGGASSIRQTLTTLELRVLELMGLSAVVGLAGIEKRRFDDQQLHPTSKIQLQSQNSAADEVLFAVITAQPSYPTEGTRSASTSTSTSSTSSTDLPGPSTVATPPPDPAPMDTATSPIESVPQRLRQRTVSPALTTSPTASTLRRRMHQRTRRRTQTPFERAIREFAVIERRRLQLEEDRQRNDHERNIEKLRLESRRLDLEESRNEILGNIAHNISEILLILRPSSLPSTTIILSDT